jgi:hypothetical protein
MAVQLSMSRTDKGLCTELQDQIDDVPLYVNVKEVVDADGSVEALELNYITCWAHNGPLAVGGCFRVKIPTTHCLCWLLPQVSPVCTFTNPASILTRRPEYSYS